VSKPPLKRIYFDTNILFRWPHISSDIPSLLRVANWVGAELFMPNIVEDELESQFVRAVSDGWARLNADVKDLEKLCHDVMDLDISGREPTETEVREAFRIRSEVLKEHFKISSIPIHEVSLETLLGMAINRVEPFEEIELSNGKHFVTGLQDTAILFSIAKHMRTASKDDRCAFLSNDGAFHRARVKDLLREAGVKVEMFRKTSDLFDDLFSHVIAAIRTAWQAEWDQIEAHLNAQKDKLTPQILRLVTPSVVGRGTWRRILEIKDFKIVEFTRVITELPESEYRPPHAAEYKRPEGSEVSISTRVSTVSEVLAEPMFFSGFITGDYTVDESARVIENLTVKDTLSVSLKGMILGGIITDFQVISVEKPESD
jgi:hypothetical protein